MLCETAADSARLLRTEIKGQIFLFFVGFTQSGLLLLRDYGKHLSDRQPHHLNFGELVWSTTGDFRHSQQRQFRLQILQLRQQFSLVLLPQLVNLNPR